jgi:uncharacterized protein (DUF983 family)
MIRFIATILHPLLVFAPVRRVRRNHGLEHATVHMMTHRVKDLQIHGGRAVLDGFFIYGPAETEDIRASVEEAIDRMRNGEHSLAVHPNCGTGLVTTGFLTTLATLVGTVGTTANWADRMARLPAMLTLSVVAVIVSQPAGLALQRYITTLGDVGDLEVVQISRHEMRLPFMRDKMTVHRIWTRAG